MNRPDYHVFIGLNESGELAMFVTEYPLSPMGARLLRGDERYPDSVLDVYGSTELSRDAVLCALKDAEGFFRGEHTTTAAPVFGQGTDKPRRKKHT